MIFFMYLLVSGSLKCFQMLQFQLFFKELMAWQGPVLVSLDCSGFCKVIALEQWYIGTSLLCNSSALPFPSLCPLAEKRISSMCDPAC